MGIVAPTQATGLAKATTVAQQTGKSQRNKDACDHLHHTSKGRRGIIAHPLRRIPQNDQRRQYKVEAGRRNKICVRIRQYGRIILFEQ